MFTPAVAKPWRVTSSIRVRTQTGGRLNAGRLTSADDTFCFTYGDGVADVDIAPSSNSTGARRGGDADGRSAAGPVRRARHGRRRGALSTSDEKPAGDGAWVNGGFFVLEPRVLDDIEGVGTLWERGPLGKLAADGQLAAYKHVGFWRPMDTLRDRLVLEEAWASDDAPWKVWE